MRLTIKSTYVAIRPREAGAQCNGFGNPKGGRSRDAKEPKMASIYRYGSEQIG